MANAIASLLERVHSLHAQLTDQDAAATRLANSVIRPLEFAARTSPTEVTDARPLPMEGELTDPQDALWQLALDATRLRVRPGVAPEFIEAVAALQDLACGSAPERLAHLQEIQAALPASIQCERGGPYLVTNVERLSSWLGEGIPVRPQMALCRCGQSALKPLCDGSHARVGFTDAKDPKRVPDRLDTYVGQQLTLLDNRGTCQHSGFCTDRLPTVFHVESDPFVTPSGGRMDEIMRVVRDCPSGALSFAIDAHEERDQVDWHGTREPAIEVSQDGPYRVTGGIPLLDAAGSDMERNHGASHEHYALCRCGHSQNKPFCSGMHYYVQFRDPEPAADRQPTLFEWCGGLPALTRMTRFFYEKYVPQDALLAPLFSQMPADQPRRVAMWLGEVFGGPRAYSSVYGGYARMLSRHFGKGLSEEQRARWVALMTQSARDAGLPADAEFRAAFGAYIEWGSRLVVESAQSGTGAPEDTPMPRWDWNSAAGPPHRRVAPAAPPPEPSAPLPGPEEAVSFDKHIKDLFRAKDRNAMKFVFDLWNVDDVRKHAAAILESLREGSMPCDGAWPSEKTDLFDRWVNTGMP